MFLVYSGKERCTQTIGDLPKEELGENVTNGDYSTSA